MQLEREREMNPSGLPKTLRRYAAVIADYSDERNSDNGIWLFYVPGIKSGSDPIGCVHQEHEETVTELLSCVRSRVQCDCGECREMLTQPHRGGHNVLCWCGYFHDSFDGLGRA